MKRHSTGMMAGGIVMVSVAPIVLLSALALSVERWSCRSSYLEPAYDEYDDYNYYERDCGDNTASVVLTLAGVGLLGAGIPLIVIGAKKEPVTADPQATISPWATPDGAGLRLRLTL